MGSQQLFKILQEKTAIYNNPDFSEEDGIKAAELEAEFGELGGYEAESMNKRNLQATIDIVKKVELVWLPSEII